MRTKKRKIEVEAPVARSARPVVATLEGMDVVEEEHGMVGSAGYCKRYVVQCKYCETAHVNHVGALKCQKKRKVDKDTLACLGAWLEGGDACESRTEHVGFAPSRSDIDAYARKLAGMRV